MGRTRLLVFTQSDNAIPVPFFIVLTFWLVVIFASFSLFAKPGAIMIAAILVFALSVSSALFLIVDLSQPFSGLMQISNHHLHVVLPKIEIQLEALRRGLRRRHLDFLWQDDGGDDHQQAQRAKRLQHGDEAAPLVQPRHEANGSPAAVKPMK